MVTGAPDWQGLRWKVETTPRPSLIHPSGRIFLVDTFESSTLHWHKAVSGTSTAALTTLEAVAGEASVFLQTGASGVEQVAITRPVGLPQTKKIGFELSFRIGGNVNHFVTFEIIRFDGTNKVDALVRWKNDDKKWVYRNSAGTLVDVTDGSQNFDRATHLWNRMKLVVDFDKEEYVNLACNEKVFNLAGISIRSATNADEPHIEPKITLRVEEALAVALKVDQVVLTEE